jgi:hypothetical protein
MVQQQASHHPLLIITDEFKRIIFYYNKYGT